MLDPYGRPRDNKQDWAILTEIRALMDMNVHAALGMAVYTGRLNLSELAGLTRDAS